MNVKFFLINSSFLVINLSFLFFQVSAEPFSGTQLYLKQNYEAAVDYWSNKAKQGDPRSLFLLGMMHLEGSGLSLKKTKAHQYLKQAALGDYRLAFPVLGMLYEEGGVGIPWEPDQAENLFLKASEEFKEIQVLAETGDVFAQRVLGLDVSQRQGG